MFWCTRDTDRVSLPRFCTGVGNCDRANFCNCTFPSSSIARIFDIGENGADDKPAEEGEQDSHQD